MVAYGISWHLLKVPCYDINDLVRHLANVVSTSFAVEASGSELRRALNPGRNCGH